MHRQEYTYTQYKGRPTLQINFFLVHLGELQLAANPFDFAIASYTNWHQELGFSLLTILQHHAKII